MAGLNTWTPRAGDIVHFRDAKNPEISGRYRLDVKQGEAGYFAFTLLRTGKAHMLIKPCVLIEWEELGTITLIDPEDIARDRLALELSLRGPLRSVRAQHGVDGLGLFDAVRSPTML